jgi:hypothetical protein
MEREDENARLAASSNKEEEQGGTAVAALGDVSPVVVAEVDVGGHRIRKLSVKVPLRTPPAPPLPRLSSPPLHLSGQLDIAFPRFPCQALSRVHACVLCVCVVLCCAVCCVAVCVSRSRW